MNQNINFAECTHARASLAHGLRKMRKMLYIYIFKAISAPPRAGTIGIKYIY